MAFITGNAADADPRGGWAPPSSMRDILYESEYDFWKVVSLTLQSHRERPIGWVILQFKKLKAMFESVEVPNNFDYYSIREESRVLRLPLVTWGLVAPFGVLGLLLCIRRRDAAFLPVWFLVGMTAITVASYILSRFRLVLVPCLVLFAVYGAGWLLKALFDRRWKGVALASVVLILVTILGRPTQAYEVPSTRHLLDALVFIDKKEFPQAIREFRKVLNNHPENALANLYLGSLYVEMSDYENGHIYLEKALEKGADPALALEGLGPCYFHLQRYDDCAAVYERLLQVDPGHLTAHFNLGLVYLRIAGKQIRGRELLSRFVELAPSDPRAEQVRALLQSDPE